MVSNTPEAVLRGCEQALGLRRFQNRIGEGFWQEWRDSNPQPAVLETAALPIELHSCASAGYQSAFSSGKDGSHKAHHAARKSQADSPPRSLVPPTSVKLDRIDWWTWGDSNPLPLRCERSALPNELQARFEAILPNVARWLEPG